MLKEGLHGLAYILTLDPLEEVRAARDDVAEKSWQELSLDDRLADDVPKNIEAELQEVPVTYENNSASYHLEHVEVPENYQTAIPQYDEKAEIDYQNSDEAAEQVYEQELEGKRFAAQFKISQDAPQFLGKEIHATAEQTEKMEMYKVCLGFAESFFRYAVKNLAS